MTYKNEVHIPEDFYFAFDDNAAEANEVETVVAITPVDYFKTFEKMTDQSLMIEDILPDDVEEIQEGIYSCERSAAEVKNDLVERGFKMSRAFSKFILGSGEE